MISQRHGLLCLSLTVCWGSLHPGMAHSLSLSNKQVQGCPPSVLEQLTEHTVQPGETLEEIAESYNVLPSSIRAMNPSLPSTLVTTGTVLSIPPYNGSLQSVAQGTTWQDLAAVYGIRADVLFEANGCSPVPPDRVFIPGIREQAPHRRPTAPQIEPQPFTIAPLEGHSSILLEYGWQQSSAQTQPSFHSGIDFLAASGTPVRAVGNGTVAFAGERGGYGMLIVINHDQGVQTRYAQLSEVQVNVGDAITKGDKIGLTGESGTATVPHLHFEVRLNSSSGWVAQDPALYLNTGE